MVALFTRAWIEMVTADSYYNKEKVGLLIHMMLAHPRYTGMGYSILSGDSRSIPLRYIDNLDAKMYMCEENYEKLEPGKITEKKPFGLDNRIYKSNYENNLEPIGFKVKAEVLI